MRLASFTTSTGPSFGIVVEGGLVDLGQRLGDTTLREVIAADALAALQSYAGDKPDHGFDAVQFLPVIPDPAKFIAVGLNYLAHVNEAAEKRDTPAFPRIFSRWNDTLIGHGEPMLRPRISSQFDYEGELAIVIGKDGHHIARDKAMEHVAGYTCFNDGSVRDWQQHAVTSGKNFFRSGPLGPWMVTADEIADPKQLTLVTRVNGEERQRTSTGDMIYDIPHLIEYCSSIGPLSPGDIIATGTPQGVAVHRKPPLWLKPGDVVEVEISGIGTLRNPVVAEQEWYGEG